MERIVAGMFSLFLAFTAAVGVIAVADYCGQMPLTTSAMETLGLVARAAFCGTVAAFAAFAALCCGANAIRG